MKTFMFFSEKGGVGKTTDTILFADYLAYKIGARVKIIDTEAPTFRIRHFRDKDIHALKSEGSTLANYLRGKDVKAPYPIDCRGCGVNQYTISDLNDLVRSVQRDINEDEYDYLLIDAPAGFSDKTPIWWMAKNGLLDLIYIPTSTEAQERRSAYIVAKQLTSMGQDVRVLWSRISPGYMKAPEILDQAEKQFEKIGVLHSPTRIKAFNKATADSDVRCFVRNTVCWPERYVQMACPELISLSEEIVTMLDKK